MFCQSAVQAPIGREMGFTDPSGYGLIYGGRISEGRVGSGKQQSRSARVFVREAFVKAARRFGQPNPRDFLELGGVGEPGNVPDDRAEVGIRTTAAKLKRVGQVV